MLDMFRRQRGKAPDESEGVEGEPLRSHIFQKLLKRLAARDHPTLLDLGFLSGRNIEIFARLGCRVQVEDLVAASEETRGATEPSQASALPATPEVPLTGPRSDPPAPEVRVETPAGHNLGQGVAAATLARPSSPLPGTPPNTPGARPSRRIVLPPRSIGRSVPARQSARPADSYRSPLATVLSYPDASLDALVAWDLLNFYDPESAKRIAAEVGRVLKPGGILFAYFHSRTAAAPEAPQRFKIVDEKQLAVEPGAGRALRRHVLQNRDIEKLFPGLRIRELYFLKNGLREMLLEKTTAAGSESPPAARPRARFLID
jgi:SAM-dependent methyltransferase